MAKIRKLRGDERRPNSDWYVGYIYIQLDQRGDSAAAKELESALGLQFNHDGKWIIGSLVPNGYKNFNGVRAVAREVCSRVNSRANQLSHPGRTSEIPGINPAFLKPINFKNGR